MWHRAQLLTKLGPLPINLTLATQAIRCVAVGGAGGFASFPPHPPFAPYLKVGVVSVANDVANGELRSIISLVFKAARRANRLQSKLKHERSECKQKEPAAGVRGPLGPHLTSHYVQHYTSRRRHDARPAPWIKVT